jgi:hypothetical protein
VVGRAGNGREAVELVGALRADRVTMPVMDGLVWSALEDVGCQPDAAAQPVGFSSA